MADQPDHRDPNAITRTIKIIRPSGVACEAILFGRSGSGDAVAFYPKARETHRAGCLLRSLSLRVPPVDAGIILRYARRFFYHALEFGHLIAQLRFSPGQIPLALIERSCGFTTKHAESWAFEAAQKKEVLPGSRK